MKTTKKCIVGKPDGIHIRTARTIVEKANEFEANFTIIKAKNKDNPMNAKSMMELMQLEALKGDKLIVKGDGEDAEDGVNALVKIIEDENE